MAFALRINTRYVNDHTGREVELPGLLTNDGLLISHLRYLASSRNLRRSASWRERSIFALKLLMSFIAANEGRFWAFEDGQSLPVTFTAVSPAAQ